MLIFANSFEIDFKFLTLNSITILIELKVLKTAGHRVKHATTHLTVSKFRVKNCKMF